MSKAAGTISIDCKCDETFAAKVGKLDYNDIATVTHDCGTKIYVGSVIDREAELVDVFAPPTKLAYVLVDASEVPEVFINVNAGDMTCRAHAGMSLSAALDSKPRARKFRTPFGDYARATELDLASWRLGNVSNGMDIAFDCETCASQKRRAA
jgi:hypothetical protein